MADNKIGAWKKTINTKNGEQTIVSFTIDGKRYTMWPNKFKKEAKHPDYQITEDNYEPKPQQQHDDIPSKELDDSLPF
jgi:hypothetical protein